MHLTHANGMTNQVMWQWNWPSKAARVWSSELPTSSPPWPPLACDVEGAQMSLGVILASFWAILVLVTLGVWFAKTLLRD